MINVDNLNIKKGVFKLGPISMKIEEGYVYAITGNSGSGKTLFLQALLGGIHTKKNIIKYDNLNFFDNDVEIKKQYSYIANKPLFSDKLKVEDLIFKIKTLDNRLNADKCFEFLRKYKVYRHKRVFELSQGEQKLLLFSIGIFTESKILVLDSPFSGVGLLARKEMITLIRNYMTDEKIVIIVTEEPYIIRNLADYIIVLKNGELIMRMDVIELQEKYKTTDIESILLDILKGEKNDEK